MGERLHTFTSPLHTLLLAGLSVLDHAREEPVRVLWMYRLLGAIALGGAFALVFDLARNQGWKGPAMIAGLGLIVLDPKSIDFTVSGMETPLMLAFLALHFHALFTGDGWRRLGVAWAALMWTRPDAFIFVLASLVATLVFGCANRTERMALVVRSLRAAALCAVLYMPWLVWATAYYGTPVPHTVVAKGLSHQTFTEFALKFVRGPREMLVNGNLLTRIYGASYTRQPSDWGMVFHVGWRVLALVAWLYWINPRGGRFARIFSLSFFLATLYGASAPHQPWYAPPYALIASMAWGFMFADAWRWLDARPDVTGFRLLRGVVIGLALALVTFQAAASTAMARTMHWHQEIDEIGNRRVLGEWLKANARPGDTVFLECVGYIGYYSNLKTYDFPGMTSREMVAARHRLDSDDFGRLIAELKPSWLVLRPDERERVNGSHPELLPSDGNQQPVYELARVFDRSSDIAGIPHILGRRYLEMDQCFEVYRRREPQAAAMR